VCRSLSVAKVVSISVSVPAVTIKICRSICCAELWMSSLSSDVLDVFGFRSTPIVAYIIGLVVPMGHEFAAVVNLSSRKIYQQANDCRSEVKHIVTGSVAFASKVNFVRTSAYQQAVNEKDKEFAEKTCDDVFAVNNVRQIVIHSSFEPHDGGVQFRRTVARDGRVRVDDQVWNGEKFSEHYSIMEKLERKLDKLIELSVCPKTY
jgi:hypothetical protein